MGSSTNLFHLNHYIAVLILGFAGDMSLLPGFILQVCFKDYIPSPQLGGLCPSVPPCLRYAKVKPHSMSLSGTRRSQQTKIPEHQRIDESSPTSGSEESEEDTKVKEKVIDRMSHPREKLAQSRKKIAQLIKGKKVK